MTEAQDIKVRLWASVVRVCVCVCVRVFIRVLLGVCTDPQLGIHRVQMCACVHISKIITVCFSHSTLKPLLCTQATQVSLHTV